MIGEMADYKRNFLREHTMAGLAAARAHGRMGSRPEALDKSQVKVALLQRLVFSSPTMLS